MVWAAAQAKKGPGIRKKDAYASFALPMYLSMPVRQGRGAWARGPFLPLLPSAAPPRCIRHWRRSASLWHQQAALARQQAKMGHCKVVGSTIEKSAHCGTLFY